MKHRTGLLQRAEGCLGSLFYDRGGNANALLGSLLDDRHGLLNVGLRSIVRNLRQPRTRHSERRGS